jgi:hypothetical protein
VLLGASIIHNSFDNQKTKNMSDKKQTALQWFLDKLPHSIETQFSEQIKEALQMEREQMKEMHGGMDSEQ